jgi:endonuclease YncB( thermonuclease family)
MATVARFVVSLASVMALGAPGGLACDLPAGEIATVAAVTDGETLQLSDGRTVRLGGVKAPSPPLGWKGEEPWPFVAEAKDRLTRALPNGAKIELRFDERREDRHGHLVAQVYIIKGADRVWLQEALVAEGLARVYILPGTRACAAALLADEAIARDARRGLWHSWAYRVRDATDVKGLGRLTQTYQVVQGTVHAVGEGQKRLYVNFAPDWRNDFTIVIERKRLARFEAAGLDFDRLAGARVRVRGWLEWWNGPMIAASDPEQIEVLSPAPAM